MSGKLFIISAPSGAGKTTLVQHAIERFKDERPIARVVTYTTKEPRKDQEVCGQDYHFITPAEFERKITEGYFLEWSNAYGNYYGTPRSILQTMAQGRSLIIILDRAGAQRIRALVSNAVLIWVYTTSLDVLRRRLKQRATESPEQIERRIQLARHEIEAEDAHPCYQFHVLNDDFYESLDRLCTIFKDFF